MNLNHHSELIRGLTKHWLQSSWAKEWSRWRQYWIDAVVLLREMTLNAPFQAVSCRYHRTNNFQLCHSSSAGASKAKPGPTQTRLLSPSKSVGKLIHFLTQFPIFPSHPCLQFLLCLHHLTLGICWHPCKTSKQRGMFWSSSRIQKL